MAALRERGEQIVEHVLRENEARWESLSEADRDRVEALARSVVSRLLHEPTLRLKRAGDGSYAQVQALRELFGLEGGRSLLELDSPELDLGADQRPGGITRLDERRKRQR